jgi:hypothetical protein
MRRRSLFCSRLCYFPLDAWPERMRTLRKRSSQVYPARYAPRIKTMAARGSLETAPANTIAEHAVSVPHAVARSCRLTVLRSNSSLPQIKFLS